MMLDNVSKLSALDRLYGGRASVFSGSLHFCLGSICTIVILWLCNSSILNYHAARPDISALSVPHCHKNHRMVGGSCLPIPPGEALDNASSQTNVATHHSIDPQLAQATLANGFMALSSGNEEHVSMDAVTASSPGTVTPAHQHLPNTAMPDVSAVSKLLSPSPSNESTVSVPSMIGSSAPSEIVTQSQEVSSLDKYNFSFKTYPFGSLSLDSIKDRMCENDVTTAYAPIDSRLKMLFVLGTQKGGTTFLFRALKRHPAFVEPARSYKHRGWEKELHYFNRFPPPPGNFLSVYNTSFTNLPTHVTADAVNYTLVEGTPDYMFNPLAPARIKALIPQARFVLVLRDPAARVYSAWKMTRRVKCPLGNLSKNKECSTFPTFQDMVKRSIVTNKNKDCGFFHPGGAGKDWLDCYKCFNSHADQQACTPEQKLTICKSSGVSTFGVSKYAAQLSLWLSFFTPDRFLILTSTNMRDPQEQIKVRSLAHLMTLPVKRKHSG